ncbi:DNA-binding protein [Paenibacillus sp. BIHB 4019]|uniref:DNA-binding protein n=1 Tax=Paenibacillus sp. BIHB 4019 TaxID=1870819 RepID=A0A1B2DJ37_9BACL|nr:MarR family transcriptional regulator [Paenibacillus sp. BIHB 4019]ANY67750.1 DNA-binding protein [Paenibacillus sp. BIHB 4019]
MGLTKRRLQFLNQLMELYQRTRLPIHYETLAKALGVSKWTAYDMMKEMEKTGFVSRSYEVNDKETGRSQVVFAPTVKAAELFRQERSDLVNPGDWEATANKIKQLLNSINHMSINELLRKIVDEIPSKTTNIEFCGYITGLLLAYLRKLGGKSEKLIHIVVNKTPSDQTRLLLFVGTVMGTIIQTVQEELSHEIADLVTEFVDMIHKLASNEQRMLADFVKEAFA